MIGAVVNVRSSSVVVPRKVPDSITRSNGHDRMIAARMACRCSWPLKGPNPLARSGRRRSIRAPILGGRTLVSFSTARRTRSLISKDRDAGAVIPVLGYRFICRYQAVLQLLARGEGRHAAPTRANAYLRLQSASHGSGTPQAFATVETLVGPSRCRGIIGPIAQERRHER